MIAQVNYESIVKNYCAGVLDGTIPACKENILAVRRYLDDLNNAGDRGFYFDKRLAALGCRRFPIFGVHHVGMQFAGNAFNLEPWQVFIVWNIWGWRRKASGLRRFKKAYITIAAKSGKTTFMGVMAWILTVSDHPIESAPQTYIVATTLDQARILYNEALKCAESKKSTRAMIHTYRAPHRIEIPSMDGIIRPVPLDGNFDGFNASYIFVDEMHAMRECHREGKEKLRSRTLARQQPLEAIITTAGNDKSELWKEEDAYAVNVVNSVVTGNIIDDTYFSMICRVDPEDDIFEERNWYKANPSLGVTIPLDTLREEANRAKHDPASLIEFTRYKCNRMVSSSFKAFTPEMWAMGNAPVVLEPREYGHGGIDASLGGDFFSVSMCFPPSDENGKYKLLSKSWCLKKKFDHWSQEPWFSLIRSGQLICQEGDMLDTTEIMKYILEMDKKYTIGTWAFDPNKMQHFASQLINEHGLQMFPFKQNSYKYSEPCHKFTEQLEAGNIIHGNDPVLSYQALNVVWESGSYETIRPGRKGRDEKIDAAVASIMAFSECLFAAKNKAEGPLYVV